MGQEPLNLLNLSIENNLIRRIDQELGQHSFIRLQPTPVLPQAPLIAVWQRKTWNTNRAVALLGMPESETHPGRFAQRIKIPLGKAIGYFPILYPLGLQLVLLVPSMARKPQDLDRFVDRLDNQRVVLQSLFVVDLKDCELFSARTWLQVVSGKFQQALEQAIQSTLSEMKQ